MDSKQGLDIATFAAGCFWGVEAAFQNFKGVKETEVGFTGGTTENPSYEQVCSHTTGHAEAVNVWFDPEEVSYNELLDLFWHIHDPTTKDRQGLNIGDNYRSAIFYHSEEQKDQAEASKEALQNSDEIQKKWFHKKVVTEIVKAGPFYRAEEYHQDFHKKHGGTC
jgi:peptide-methionine (S)-S-oxide reductase